MSLVTPFRLGWGIGQDAGKRFRQTVTTQYVGHLQPSVREIFK